MDQATQQVVVGVMATYVIQFLKLMPWFPLLTEQSDKIIKVAFSALVAGCSAISIEVGWNGLDGVLTFSGLTWLHVWHGLLAFALSFAAQHGWYQLMLKQGKT